MGTLRSRFALASSSIALLALCFHCGGESGSLFGDQQGCPTSLADRCGAQCSLDSECPESVHCGMGGTCTAECAPGTTCDNGIACSPRGRCSTDPGSGLNNTPLEAGPEPGDGSVCAATEVAMTKVKPKVLFLLDQSSSMWRIKFPDGDSTVGGVECKSGCRWTVLKDVLIGPNVATGGILKKLEGEAELGVQMYSATDAKTGDGDDSYLPATPAPANVCPRFNGKAFSGNSFALNNAAAIDAMLRPATVDDDTPTGPAIRSVVGIGADGKINDPNGFAADKTDSPKVLVLVTDGEPAVCGSNDASEAGKALVVSAVQQTFTQKIKTFVIAIGSAGASAHFKAVANAGQGKNPTTGDAEAIKPSTPQQLVDALTKVVLDARTCTFKLDGEIPVGQEKSGTVTLNGNPLPFDEPGAPDEGWRVVDKSNIELVGSACTTLKTTPDAKLKASFPCGVVVPITPR